MDEIGEDASWPEGEDEEETCWWVSWYGSREEPAPEEVEDKGDEDSKFSFVVLMFSDLEVKEKMIEKED